MTTREILARFRDLSVLVVGDICLDRWCVYDPQAADVSRETGIPRLGVVRTRVTAGAGGTIANNLASLGAGRISVLGVAGCDGFGFELKEALAAEGVESNLLVESGAVQTFTYTKLLNQETGIEDRPRVDFINTQPTPAEVEGEILERFEKNATEFDVVLVSDQAETAEGGVVSTALRERLAGFAMSWPAKTVWVDSRLRAEHFRRVIVKPNQEEAEAACQRLLGRIDFPSLREHIAAPALFVTHGPRGVLTIDDAGEEWIRARPVEEPVDICGAGDSFTAGASLALSVTGSPAQAARIGNLVAGVTIMKPDTGTASPDEVLAGEGRRQS